MDDSINNYGDMTISGHDTNTNYIYQITLSEDTPIEYAGALRTCREIRENIRKKINTFNKEQDLNIVNGLLSDILTHNSIAVNAVNIGYVPEAEVCKFERNTADFNTYALRNVLGNFALSMRFYNKQVIRVCFDSIYNAINLCDYQDVDLLDKARDDLGKLVYGFSWITKHRTRLSGR